MLEILIPLEELLREDMPQDLPVRVPGTALFMTRDVTMAPPAMMRNLRHNKVLHNRNVFLTVATRDVPYVSRKDRAETEDLGRGFWRVSLTYGFMQTPDVPRALKNVKIPDIDWAHTTYFVGRETLVATSRPGMAIWRERLFAVMSHNTRSAASFFHLPPGHIVELGSRVEL
jgi:KUP system potassium uptake protein